MLKSFLQHHLDRALDGQVRNVLMDCHVKGVCSMVLHDEPGNRVRMFFASKDHNLAANSLLNSQPMTIAAHPHHSDVTFVGIFGSTYNHIVRMVPHAYGTHTKCIYHSGVVGRGCLEPTDEKFLLQWERTTEFCSAGESLRAAEVHTLSVDAGKDSAWLVLEGRPDPGYRSVCYTNNTEFDPTGLYQSKPEMASAVLAYCLERVGKNC